MEITIFDVCTLSLKDIFDMLIVATIMYQLYRFLKGTSAINIFSLLLSFVIIWFFVNYVLQMELLGSILNAVANVGVILIIVIFQDEIRNFLSSISSRRTNSLYNRIKRLLVGKQKNIAEDTVNEIAQAAVSLSKTKTGALIVIQKEADLTTYWQTGDRIDAKVNSRLLENIFFKNTPLHDGAVIVVGDEIRAAACILPVSHRKNLPRSLGLRHRSALGISERTDAMVIVVSEETGKISCMKDGELAVGVNSSELKQFLYTGVIVEKKK